MTAPHTLPAETVPQGTSGWCPFGPPEAGLRVGPNLAVALPGGRLAPPEQARELLLRHALARSAPIDRGLDAATADIPLGTPFEAALRAHARALPGFALHRPAPDRALLLRAPEAVLELGAGKLGELEQGRWRTGPDALDLLLRHRAAWEPGAGADVLTARPEAPEGLRLRRALALGAAALAGGPVTAAPLLAADAVLWLIGTALAWTAAIVAAPATLRAWDRRRPQPALRLDPWRLWLPATLGPPVTDRAALTARLSWRPAFGVASTGVSGRAPSVRNPAMTFLHLQAPGLDLTLATTGAPPDPDRTPRAEGAITGPLATLPAAAFRAFAAPFLSRPAR